MLDVARVLADQHLGKVLNCAHDTTRFPLERGLSPAPKPWLISLDLHEYPISHFRIHDYRSNSGDFHKYAHQELSTKYALKTSHDATSLNADHGSFQSHQIRIPAKSLPS